MVGPQPDDQDIVLEQAFNHERGEATGILRFSKLKRADDGLYQCLASNKAHTDFRTGHVTVQFPPTFEHMNNLPPVFTWEERRANLSCFAQGKKSIFFRTLISNSFIKFTSILFPAIPNATIEWRWNERPIIQLNDANLEIVNEGPRSDLLVRPRGRHYYSAYKCFASNTLGTAEKIMELREAHIPGVIPQARAIVVTATSMTFEIIAPQTEIGLPNRAYSVQYKEHIEPDWANAIDRTWSPGSKYAVEGLKPQTFYMFRFAARNQVGLGPWGAYVTQSTPRRSVPEPPKILHSTIQNWDNKNEDPLVVSPYSDHFELSWGVPPDNGEPINFYEIKYCPVCVKNL